MVIGVGLKRSDLHRRIRSLPGWAAAGGLGESVDAEVGTLMGRR